MTKENADRLVAGLLDRYGDRLKGLLHYGSTAFGQPRMGSAYDFWLIVDDLWKFHRRFSPQCNSLPSHATHLGGSVAARVRLNTHAPNFYGVEQDGVEMKLCVVDEETFCRMCRALSFYVKGRMQKPVRIIRASDRIAQAIHDARADGVKWALDLLPGEFDFDEFLRALLGLSYQTEIRPEITAVKIQSIIESGREELEKAYRPLLDGNPLITQRDGRYLDARGPQAKAIARRRALRELRRMRWQRETLDNIYRNYRTYPTPIRYVLKKVFGEARKLLR